jgi:hypothetical protein
MTTVIINYVAQEKPDEEFGLHAPSPEAPMKQAALGIFLVLLLPQSGQVTFSSSPLNVSRSNV